MFDKGWIIQDPFTLNKNDCCKVSFYRYKNLFDVFVGFMDAIAINCEYFVVRELHKIDNFFKDDLKISQKEV